ncbi:MAG: proprotein convertase P-domain-containing protein [Chitinophagales bacterium]
MDTIAQGCHNDTTIPIPSNDPVGITSTIDNFASEGYLNNGTTVVRVCVLLEHDRISDIDITLVCPDGIDMQLSSNVGGNTQNYGDVVGQIEVCFTPDADQTIYDYVGGDTGDYLPEGGYVTLSGCDPNGAWSLIVVDDNNSTDNSGFGELISWTLELSSGLCSADPPCLIGIGQNDILCEPVSGTGGIEYIINGGTPPYVFINNGNGNISPTVVTTASGSFVVENLEDGDFINFEVSDATCGLNFFGGSFNCDLPCTASAGTISTSNGSNAIALCEGDSFSINSNNDYVLPTASIGQEASLMYIVYNCEPPNFIHPLGNACATNVYWTGPNFPASSVAATNTGNLPSVLLDLGVVGTITPTGTDIWLVPITIDNQGGGTPHFQNIINFDLTGDNCFGVGEPIHITYFEKIQFDEVINCDPSTNSGNAVINIEEGVSPYFLTNIGAGTFSHTTITGGGLLTVSGLQVGDTYGVDLVDSAGCFASFSNVYTCSCTVTASQNATICSDEVFVLPNGSIASETGTYSSLLTTANGCDSIVTTNLNVYDYYDQNIYTTVCNDEAYILPDGTTTSISDTYTYFYSTINNCDSIINIHLTFDSAYTLAVDVAICSGESYTLPDGMIVTESGSYDFNLITVAGCDSIINIGVDVQNAITTNENITLCIGEAYTLQDGNIVDESGTYTVTLNNSAGICDSVFVTNLTIENGLNLNYNDVVLCDATSYFLDATVNGATAYLWEDGSTLSNFYAAEAGTYSVTVTDENGCTNEGSINVTSNAPNANFGTSPDYFPLEAEYCADSDLVILLPYTEGGTFDGEAVFDNIFIPRLSTILNEPFDITYTLIDENGCIGMSSQTVIVYDLPNANFTLLNSYYTPEDEPVVLIPEVAGGTFTGACITNGNIFNPALVDEDTPCEICYVIANDGCSNATCQSIYVAPCVPPVELNISNVTANTALLNWSEVSAASSYLIRYRLNGSGNTWTYLTSENNEILITGLNPCTEYEYQVGTNCAGIETNYGDDFVFTTANCTSYLSIRVLLEGAFNSTSFMMDNSLRTNGLIPVAQPFNDLPYEYEGSESVATVFDQPLTAVDWVLIELRTSPDPADVVVQKAAFLLRNGYITDAESSDNQVAFEIEPNDYYIVVRHRSHLDIMSATPVSLSNDEQAYNFTTGASQAYGNNQQKMLFDDVYAMWASDIDGNGVTTNMDFNIYSQQLSSINEYLNADLNLDGIVSIADFNLYQMNASVIGISEIRF